MEKMIIVGDHKMTDLKKDCSLVANKIEGIYLINYFSRSPLNKITMKKIKVQTVKHSSTLAYLEWITDLKDKEECLEKWNQENYLELFFSVGK